MVQSTPVDRSFRVGFRPLAWIAVLTIASGAGMTGLGAERDAARQILDATGVKGGWIVHLGCGDGKLTAAFRAGDGYLVHGLDTDADLVRQAREYVRKEGVYGPVSIERFDGKRLPYADNLVNLVVGERLGDVAMDEAMRVLAPGGVLYVKQQGRWVKRVKPRPGNIDEWTHYFHDASGNAVAHDEVVGPPGRIQWTAGPPHTRSHEHIPGIFALVSSGGRIFYIVDDAPVASVRQLPKWRLAARDAFNGTLLWKRPIAEWFPHIINWGQTPRELQRKLVAAGDRVYVTLGLYSPLSAVDAATGETVKVYEDTDGTEEIVLHRGVLLLAVQGVTEERTAELARFTELLARKESPLDDRDSADPLVKRLRETEGKGKKTVLAVDAQTGRELWRQTDENAAGLRTYSLCAQGDRVFYQTGNRVICLDLESGQTLWSASAPPLRLVHGESVFCVGGEAMKALAVADGQVQWTEKPLLVDTRDAFIAGGSLWLGGFKAWQGRKSGKRGPAWGPYFATQRDPATGKVLMHIEPENPGHHHRCYNNKATDRYIIGGRRGTEFIDLEEGEVLWNSWARGVCKYGVMPSNGLLYTPPHACGCYVGAKLTGFNALAARGKGRDEGREARDEGVLERGPAYGGGTLGGEGEWSMYRCDAERSGFSPGAVPVGLGRRWEAAVGGRISSPTVAEGKVFVAAVDGHEVVAIDADSGEPAWRFTAGARVDSPPSLYEGRAIFGCRDGYVYSVRASDGALAWRLRAARRERWIAVCGQLESVSPVLGSVLIRDGVVHLTAGRTSYTDGGIDLCRVEPGTGELLSRTAIYSPDPETGRQPAQSAPAAMPGTRADILTSDGDCIYLRDMPFDHRGKLLSEGNPHLFTLTDFLDDSWPHRSYWIFGTRPSISTGCSRQEKDLVFGRLLVFNDSTIIGYGRKTLHWSNRLQDGAYRLFAVKRGEVETQWAKPLPITVRAMVLADKVLFVAGFPKATSPWLEERDEDAGAVLMAVSALDGAVLGKSTLAAPPAFDGMAATGGRLYISLENGHVVCMDKEG